MKVLKEFKEFINKGNVVDLAVAVVIGGAFGKIVSALVADMVMPLVNAVVPEGDWRKWEVSPLKFRLGDFLGTVVDFTIVAFVVFIIMVKIVGTVNKKAAAPETRTCPECLESVPKAARRCRACTSVLTALGLLLLLGAPTFAHGKPDANSQTTDGTLALSVSRTQAGPDQGRGAGGVVAHRAFI